MDYYDSQINETRIATTEESINKTLLYVGENNLSL